MSMALNASVILCTRNRCADLLLCLESLAHQTVMPQEIIVVDSSDTPLERNNQFLATFVTSQFPETKLSYFHTKPGLTYQRNYGIKRALGSVIYFFDDDVILHVDYLEQMQKVFDSHPSYAGGMGDIININKKPSLKYRWLRKFFLLPHEGGSGNFTWSGMPTHPYGTKKFKSVEIAGGCCMAFRATVLKHHYFDEHFHGYASLEDADIGRRISLEQPLFFNPSAQLIHNESPAARDRVAVTSAMFVYNYSYLFFKNFYRYNRLKIIGYWWSVIGLFVQAFLMRNKAQLKGYRLGIYSFYFKKRM